MFTRSILLATASLTFAATASAQSGDVLFDEIIVTATKSNNPETVQDVAIAVTAANEQTLEALKVRTIEDLSLYAPNVVLSDIGTSRGTANFSIRGLGINSSIPSIDPTVGVFIDGVYLGQNAGVVFDTFDLESVEILRGPQGLLFGRNTTGGAVLINTKNPTDVAEVNFRAAVEGPVDSDRGGLNHFIMGNITGPLVEEKLNGKLAVYYNNDDGYFENLATGNNVGAAQTFIIRGALDVLLGDANLLLKGEQFTSQGDGPVPQNRAFFERDTFDASYDNEGGYDNEIFNGSATLTIPVSFGDGEIVNIFGYRDYAGETDSDIDALPAFIFHSTTELEQDQWSNELRYAGSFGSLDLTTGVYYFEQDTQYTERRFIPPRAAFDPVPGATGPNGTASQANFFGGGDQQHDVLGIFANVDFALTDQLILTGGLRYTEENKDVGVAYVVPRDECSVVEGTCPFAGVNPVPLAAALPTGIVLIPGNNGFVDSDSWSNLTPKVGIQYLLDDTTNLYATYTKGFRSGGYNFRITNPNAFEQQVAGRGGQVAFDEEEVDAFEIGAKYTSNDRRIVLNAAAFYTDISDMQREVNESSQSAGVVQNILNTADAEILGAEIEGRFRASDNITLTGNLGLIDAEYTDVIADISGDGIVNDVDLGLDLPRVPEATYGAGIIADLGALSGRVNFQHRDRTAYTDSNLGFIQPIDDLSASLVWQASDSVSISLYGKNLLDEVQVGGDTQVPFGGPRSSRTGPNDLGTPYADRPLDGTFSPLKKGRVIGLELNASWGANN